MSGRPALDILKRLNTQRRRAGGQLRPIPQLLRTKSGGTTTRPVDPEIVKGPREQTKPMSDERRLDSYANVLGIRDTDIMDPSQLTPAQRKRRRHKINKLKGKD